MRRKRFSVEQIMAVLKQGEVGMPAGGPLKPSFGLSGAVRAAYAGWVPRRLICGQQTGRRSTYIRELSWATHPNLLNQSIPRIALTDIPDPDQALTPLSMQFPNQQVGYMHMGGENTYAKPWTVTFENITVRQLANRLAEHIGSQSSWVWQGGKKDRMFTILKGGFHTATSEKQSKAN